MWSWEHSGCRCGSRWGCWSRCWCRYWSTLCAIGPTRVGTRVIRTSAPDDHLTSRFAPGPHCSMKLAGGRCVGSIGCRPSIRGWDILAACVQVIKGIAMAAPHDHLCASPNSCVIFSAVGCDVAGIDPCVAGGIVSSTCARKAKIIIGTAPYDHLTCCPHSGMRISRRRRVDRAGRCPTVRRGIISAACI